MASAPPYRIYVWSLDLVRIVSRLTNSSLDAGCLVECVRVCNLTGSLVIIVVGTELLWPRCVDSMERRRLTRVLIM